MFPVLISLDNEGGVLLPGMNGEVTMVVDQRQNVLAVPVDAVRSVREVQAIATALGVRPDSAKAQVDRQMAARAAERAGGMARADSGRAGPLAGGSGPGGTGAAGAQGRGDDAERLVRIAQRRFNGDTAAARKWMNERRAEGGGAGGGGSGRGSGTGNWSGSSTGSRNGSWAGGQGGNNGPAPAGGVRAGMSTGGGGGLGGGRSRAQVVFVQNGKSLEARVVRLGLSDFDYAEVISGVQEGEQVALVGVAEAQAQRTQTQQNIRQRMGSGVVPGAGGGGGGRGAGGGGGGTGGGGGGSGGSRPSGGGGR